MSLIKTGAVQVGQSNTASNNFHWRNLLDGLLRLSRGNAGSPITDVMRVKADNSVEFPGGVVDPRTPQNLTASRVVGVSYTNTDAFAREVTISASATGEARISAQLGDLPVFGNTSNGSTGTDYASVTFKVNPGEIYKAVESVGTLLWLERRV